MLWMGNTFALHLCHKINQIYTSLSKTYPWDSLLLGEIKTKLTKKKRAKFYLKKKKVRKIRCVFSTKISTATICVVFLSFTNMVTGGIRSLHSSGFNCRKGGETKHTFGIFSPQVCICVICSDRTATFAVTRHTWHRAMPMCTLFSLDWRWELPQ